MSIISPVLIVDKQVYETSQPLGHRSVKVLLDLLQRAWDEHLLQPQLSPPDITADTFNDEFIAWCREQGYTLSIVALFLECYAFLQDPVA